MRTVRVAIFAVMVTGVLLAVNVRAQQHGHHDHGHHQGQSAPHSPSAAGADHEAHGAHGAQPYAGQHKREISSLSADDIAQLEAGQGWGLAKSAEFNGWPGPAHLLEMRDEIGLNGTQIDAIEALHTAMQDDAKAAGKRLIALERELDRLFRSGDATETLLRDLLAEVAVARAELRFVHLSAHLKTPQLLRTEQIDAYNRLRGYDVSE